MKYNDSNRDRLLQLIDDGLISAQSVAEMAIQWLNDDEVADMCRANDVQFFEEETENE